MLAGAEQVLRRTSFILAEVNEGGMYQGDCSLDDMQEFLNANGFRMKYLHMSRHGYGDAFFMR